MVPAADHTVEQLLLLLTCGFCFTGIGVAWTLAAIVNAFRGQPFKMKKGNLAFSLTIFCGFALSAIVLLLFRRTKAIGMYH